MSVASKQSVDQKVYCQCLGPRRGAMFAAVHVFGNSRNPGTLLKVSHPQGRTVGNMIRTGSKKQGSRPSLLSSALWRVRRLAAGRNSKELGAVAGLCGDVFDYMQLAPLHQGTNHHRMDNGPRPAHHTDQLPLIDTSNNRACALLTIRQQPISNQCSSCYSAIKPSLYKYLPDAVPRLRTLVSRIPSAFTADSDDNIHGDHNTQPD